MCGFECLSRVILLGWRGFIEGMAQKAEQS